MNITHNRASFNSLNTLLKRWWTFTASWGPCQFFYSMSILLFSTLSKAILYSIYFIFSFIYLLRKFVWHHTSLNFVHTIKHSLSKGIPQLRTPRGDCSSPHHALYLLHSTCQCRDLHHNVKSFRRYLERQPVSKPIFNAKVWVITIIITITITIIVIIIIWRFCPTMIQLIKLSPSRSPRANFYSMKGKMHFPEFWCLGKNNNSHSYWAQWILSFAPFLL